jgi:type II secretion system protein N
MRPRLRRVLKGMGYPAFYTFSLFVFFGLTFPYDRLKSRVVAEFNSRQPAGAGTRLEVDEMSGYWLSGVEAEGVKLTSPAAPAEDGKPREARVVKIDEIHARVSLLRLLFGTLRISFGGDVFGGKLSGSTSDADGARSVDVELDAVDVGDLPAFREMVGLPLQGKLSGTIQLELPESKFSKAEGKIELTIVDLAIGDGKAKIRDTIALPKLEAGELTLEASASEGRLKLDKLAANGKDIELDADGAIRLRDPVETSLAELSLRFKFSDAYKKKNDTTKALFGDPGSPIPGLFDLDPKNKRAKRPDGFYGFRLTGPLSKLDAQPTPFGAASGAAPSRGPRGFSPTR